MFLLNFPQFLQVSCGNNVELPPVSCVYTPYPIVQTHLCTTVGRGERGDRSCIGDRGPKRAERAVEGTKGCRGERGL